MDDTAAKAAKLNGLIAIDMALRQPPASLKTLLMSGGSFRAIARGLPPMSAMQRLAVEVKSAFDLGIFRKSLPAAR